MKRWGEPHSPRGPRPAPRLPADERRRPRIQHHPRAPVGQFLPMGGFDTRSVWSPSGGWYADPRGWRRNTALAFGAVAVASYFVASVSAKMEVRACRCAPRYAVSRLVAAAARSRLFHTDARVASRALPATPATARAAARSAQHCGQAALWRRAVPRHSAPAAAAALRNPAAPDTCAAPDVRALRRSNGRWRPCALFRRSGGATTSRRSRRSNKQALQHRLAHSLAALQSAPLGALIRRGRMRSVRTQQRAVCGR